MTPLKIKIVVEKSGVGFILEYSVLSQPDKLRTAGSIFIHNGVSIESINCPQLIINSVDKTITAFIRGSTVSEDNRVDYSFYSDKQLVIDSLDKIYCAFMEFNKLNHLSGGEPEIIIEDSAKPFIF